jgi:hypothetical protein
VLAAALAAGLACRGLVASPIAGGEGNREFLALLERGSGHAPLDLEGLVRSDPRA